MAWRPRLDIKLAIPALVGAAAALGQAPFGLWPATLVGLAIGAYLIGAAPDARQAAWRGWALGVGYFALTLSWIVQPFFVDPWVHGWMAPFAIALMAAGLALFWALASGLSVGVGAGRLWAWPFLMSAAELLRGWIFTGFPWGEPGLVWVDTPVAQLAAFVGAAGLTLLTFVAASALARGRVCAGGALVALALAWGLGVGLGGLRPSEVPGTGKLLRLVQPNAAQHLKWHPDHVRGFLERQISLSATPSERAPDLVIWPETAVPYLLHQAGPVFARIAEAAGAPTVLGIQRAEGGRYYNSMAVIGANGAVQGVYDKAHLVPFGEYVPGGDLLARFGIGAFAAQRGFGYSAGPGAEVLELDGVGTLLPLICYEAIFARDLRAAPKRADWILQITNDAWFGTFSGPQQHLAQARMRAIEMGLPFVRAANTGISAVIDPHGRMVASLGLGQQGVVDAELPQALPETPYARLGNLPLMLVLLLGGLGLFVRRGGKPIDPGAEQM